MQADHILRLINLGLRKMRLSCRKGYTLMEVMLVVFLIALILGIATIFFANSLPAARLRATGRDMAAAIKYAKYLAKANNERQMFNIDLDYKTYTVEGRETRRIPPDVMVTILDTNLDVITTGRFSIAFDAMGGNDWHSIILSRGRSEITIAMDPVMAAVIAGGTK
ncbi:MAG: Tfp pilus assembly protein FimT/FimU [Syntrophales bacterium]